MHFWAQVRIQLFAGFSIPISFKVGFRKNIGKCWISGGVVQELDVWNCDPVQWI